MKGILVVVACAIGGAIRDQAINLRARKADLSEVLLVPECLVHAFEAPHRLPLPGTVW
jgi:hypothetical protein